MVRIEEIVRSATNLMELLTDKIVTPLLILFLGVIISRLVKNGLEKFGHSVGLDSTGKKFFGQEAPYAELLAGGVAAIIITVAVIWALYIAGILREAFQVVLVLFGIILFLGALLFLRDVLPNTIARARVKHRYKEGNKIEVMGISGPIKRFHLLSVEIASRHGVVHIPYRCFPREVQS